MEIGDIAELCSRLSIKEGDGPVNVLGEGLRHVGGQKMAGCRRLGFGVVFRDFACKVLVSYTSLLLGLFSPDIGEALAILLGLRLAIDMGLSTVCVESDAASIVKQLSSRATSCSDIGLVLDDILSLAVDFSDKSLSICVEPFLYPNPLQKVLREPVREP
ncbi:hypothetical protein ACOSQ3_008533 [Xanthoceras sorbifolium]